MKMKSRYQPVSFLFLCMRFRGFEVSRLRLRTTTHHGDHVIDLLHSQPVQHVRHQRLESHILHPGDQLGRLEVPIGGISGSFARVVDQVCMGVKKSHRRPKRISRGMEVDVICEKGARDLHLVTSPKALPSFLK